MVPVIALALVCMAQTAFVCFVMQSHERELRALQDERRQLADRIQAPDRIPPMAATIFESPEREPDEWAKVGTIEIDPKYGFED